MTDFVGDETVERFLGGVERIKSSNFMDWRFFGVIDDRRDWDWEGLVVDVCGKVSKESARGSGEELDKGIWWEGAIAAFSRWKSTSSGTLNVEMGKLVAE